jgi:GDPmannose 4,6-dehydratase
VDYLLGDPGKARRLIGWEPRVFFKDLVRIMVAASLDTIVAATIMVDADTSTRLSTGMEFIGLQSKGEGRKILEKHHGKWHRWEGQVVSMG